MSLEPSVRRSARCKVHRGDKGDDLVISGWQAEVRETVEDDQLVDMVGLALGQGSFLGSGMET